jgi:4-hydroxy-tetrahydrodipicolinate reductase
MRITLIGYGKMGKAIEKIAIERGHEVVLKIDLTNPEDFSKEKISNCDVAIEFSNPHAVLSNIEKCLAYNIPMVVGTTAWLHEKEDIKNKVLLNNSSFVWASNFSLGANLFFKLNQQLADIMNEYVNERQYNVQVEEIHHTQKLDAPSGTALTIANDIVEKLSSKVGINALGVKDSSILNQHEAFTESINVNALRIDDVPGTHTINYYSNEDSISITHTAHNRNGFALGAVIAAERIIKTKGFYEFRELLFT